MAPELAHQHFLLRYSHLAIVIHVIIISAPAPNGYINLWISFIKYSTLNVKCNGQHGGSRACFLNFTAKEIQFDE